MRTSPAFQVRVVKCLISEHARTHSLCVCFFPHWKFEIKITSFKGIHYLLFLPVASSLLFTSNRCPSSIGFSKRSAKSSFLPKQLGLAQSKTHQKSRNLFCNGVPVKPILKSKQCKTLHFRFLEYYFEYIPVLKGQG